MIYDLNIYVQFIVAYPILYEMLFGLHIPYRRSHNLPIQIINIVGSKLKCHCGCTYLSDTVKVTPQMLAIPQFYIIIYITQRLHFCLHYCGLSNILHKTYMSIYLRIIFLYTYIKYL